eukprot:jgi/Hompol1/1592/HPOL_002723-RA
MTAARQLGDVQRQHPDELYALLARILVHIRSRSWDTRAAAAEAIGAIARSVPRWDPNASQPDPQHHSGNALDGSEQLLSFSTVDLLQVLEKGAALVASAGAEFDADLSSMDPKERIALQKRQLRERLGIATQFMDVSFVEDADLNTGITTTQQNKLSVSEVIAKQKQEKSNEPDPYAGLSARQINMLKRKAKTAAKSGGYDKSKPVDLSVSSTAALKKRKVEEEAVTVKADPDAVQNTGTNVDTKAAVVVEFKQQGDSAALAGVSSAGDEWPFEGLFEQLSLDLFSPVWEIRHGAALGLRELLKAHGFGLARISGLPLALNNARHAAWEEDLALRLLCVLALDRFADFVGDQAVLPVREICAQTLGVVMQQASPSLCLDVVNRGLLPLLGVSNASVIASPTTASSNSGASWEARHSALIGLKFWMAVRQDLLPQVLLPPSASSQANQISPVFAAILNGLKDPNDDVRAVSSSALIPVTDLVVSTLAPETVFRSLVMSLWDCLQELDDLTSATSFVMDLLSTLVTKPSIAAIMQQEAGTFLQKLIPQLFPFFRHAITSVRTAVLRTLSTIIEFSEADSSPTAGNWISVDLLRLIFQNFVLEENTKIIDASLELWNKLVRYILRSKHLLSPSSSSSSILVSGITEKLPALFGLLMSPIGTPLEQSLFVRFTSNSVQRRGEVASTAARSKSSNQQQQQATDLAGLNISLQDRAMIQQDLIVVSPDAVLRGRIAGASAIGSLLFMLSHSSLPSAVAKVSELLIGYAASAWAAHRIFSSIIIEELAHEWPVHNSASPSGFVTSSPLASSLCEMLNTNLSNANAGTSLLYLELVPSLSSVWHECYQFFKIAHDAGVGGVPALPPLASQNIPPHVNPKYVSPAGPLGPTFTIQVCDYVLKMYPMFVEVLPNNHMLVECHTRILAGVELFKSAQLRQETQVHASAASAVVAFRHLPSKLNPIIRALMNSIKLEENEQMQQRSAQSIAHMIQLNLDSSGDKAAVVNDKITKNLCGFLCSNPETVGESKSIRDRDGILSLVKDEALLARSVGILSSATPSKGKNAAGAAAAAGSSKTASDAGSTTQSGKKKKAAQTAAPSMAVETDDIATAAAVAEASKVPEQQAQQRAREIACRGAEAAIKGFCDCFGPDLLNKLPKLVEAISVPQVFTQTHAHISLPSTFELDPDDAQTQPLIESLHILAVTVKYVHADVHHQILPLVSPVCKFLRASLALARYLAAKCTAALCHTIGVPAFKVLISEVLPFTGDSTSDINRQGAVECIHHIVQTMDTDVLPYLVFLIAPLLARMSDSNERVRFIATNVFATLVKLAPLEAGIPDPDGFTPEMIQHKVEERKFIGQLIGTDRVQTFELPIKIDATLRNYQVEGVSWLAFLNRYGLHDMGLGKTLQTICMMASDHFLRTEKFKSTKLPEFAHCPSLVVCPSSLTGHWFFEIQKYAAFLRPFIYFGNKEERQRMRKSIMSYDIIITSYEILRSDIDDLSTISFNYCTLDEGHVIKNPSTKLSKAAKSIKALHRLILSGTPIQNNVVELWSLFDFLMPGFLGTELQFNERYGKPILASRDAKATSREQERGALALEALHKQVLPFLLRRMKEDVLDDLPPKIIQDYYCELSDMQKILYEEFGKSRIGAGIRSDLGEDDEADDAGANKSKKAASSGPAAGGQHIFQALQYLRKLCNHPSLVVKPEHPQYSLVQSKLKLDGRTIDDISYAPKITALQQLLLDCGIGAESSAESSSDPIAAIENAATAPHRALIFAQTKAMLDIIERDLFKQHMPTVTYMRLESATDGVARHALVNKFNSDPSIDVLLLTTHVGGLGLNLTGADTVIFVEHDWNPSKDLQAMDRAHRIGQKRVVNVYRLITRGTLEEKIMGLQKFKMNIASSVINQENTGISSMDTTQILDLFSLDSSAKGTSAAAGSTSSTTNTKPASGKLSAKKALENLESLWDESQYDDMHVDDFLKKLGR